MNYLHQENGNVFMYKFRNELSITVTVNGYSFILFTLFCGGTVLLVWGILVPGAGIEPEHPGSLKS